MAIDSFGGSDRLRPVELDPPQPSHGEILVRVVAAGLNPIDCRIREGGLRGLIPHAFPLIPGWDLAGVVEDLGSGCQRFRRGDKVWAMARKPLLQWGTYAEQVCVEEASAAPVPARLLFEEAAAVPTAGLAAWQALHGGAGIGPGRRVLVHAAAGGVGHLAVQLAAEAGAVVIGTAGPDNQDFVADLGASLTIDYSREDFVERTRSFAPEGVDLVLDSLGGGEWYRNLELTRPGGRLVSLIGRPDPDAAAARKVDAVLHDVRPDALQLNELAKLVDQRRLRPHVQKIFPLSGAAEAQDLLQRGHVRGKLVLNL